jgi:hypothetical protein
LWHRILTNRFRSRFTQQPPQDRQQSRLSPIPLGPPSQPEECYLHAATLPPGLSALAMGVEAALDIQDIALGEVQLMEFNAVDI